VVDHFLLFLISTVVQPEGQLHGHDGDLLRRNEQVDRDIKRLPDELVGVVAVHALQSERVGQMGDVDTAPKGHDRQQIVEGQSHVVIELVDLSAQHFRDRQSFTHRVHVLFGQSPARTPFGMVVVAEAVGRGWWRL